MSNRGLSGMAVLLRVGGPPRVDDPLGLQHLQVTADQAARGRKPEHREAGHHLRLTPDAGPEHRLERAPPEERADAGVAQANGTMRTALIRRGSVGHRGLPCRGLFRATGTPWPP